MYDFNDGNNEDIPCNNCGVQYSEHEKLKEENKVLSDLLVRFYSDYKELSSADKLILSISTDFKGVACDYLKTLPKGDLDG